MLKIEYGLAYQSGTARSPQNRGRLQLISRYFELASTSVHKLGLGRDATWWRSVQDVIGATGRQA